MTRKENIELVKAAQSGDSGALDALVSQNMGLCKSIAVRFLNRGVEYDDLVQLASVGMIKAVRSFDTSFGTAFSTYAVPLIIGEIRRFLRDDGIVKVGRNIKRIGTDAMKKKEEFLREHGREPKMSELSELCGVPVEELVSALDASCPVKSIYEPIGSDSDGACIGDLLSDDSDEIGKTTDKIALSEAIRSLPETQRKLIYLRYVKEMSQANTGRILGMTQVKVSREEKKIIEALRRAL
ncbi:MAG: sigma-70 family RNA polymerase sigma factor [Ruminococcaceae bacterium]|nr:sigma-70 family RNA polymerase sigma factor [Oscillospiraceae bacterium]